LFQFFGFLLQRLFAQLLRPAAEAMAFQARDPKAQPRDLGQRRAQKLLQDRRIVRQGRGDGEHGDRMNRARESDQMNFSLS